MQRLFSSGQQLILLGLNTHYKTMSVVSTSINISVVFLTSSDGPLTQFKLL